MLLPLSTETVRSSSLEHYMALALARYGNGDRDGGACLPGVVYHAFVMRSETTVYRFNVGWLMIC
ncbi:MULTISPECIES: hypothetical protein [Burkholderia]|uniref:Uncharacterized protein n=1 Tax=Burkholderia paludis TaxID=1506587 RepID=A0A6J5D8H7_9BURK|nr:MULTISPECIES: hypothetical protein [Burkholderia]CAB3749711.1 hypothetical protein LMG30113_01046 [Burkholderia paludis]VWB15810.1 hypothetical protein BPA30113_00448 [Burkholderia paludis]